MLAAINDAAQGLAKPSDMGRQNAMLKSSKVTNSIARDLTSHASEAPSQRDFNHLKDAGKTLLTARNMNQGPPKN